MTSRAPDLRHYYLHYVSDWRDNFYFVFNIGLSVPASEAGELRERTPEEMFGS